MLPFVLINFTFLLLAMSVESNPFLNDLIIEVVDMKKKEYMVPSKIMHLQSEDRISEEYESRMIRIRFEKQRKKHVYDVLDSGNFLFEKLNRSGRDLFLYVIYKIKVNKDFIHLPYDVVCSDMGSTKPTLRRGLKNLCSAGVLCKKRQSEYWVNPRYVFKGNRVKFYQETHPECISVVYTIEEGIPGKKQKK